MKIASRYDQLLYGLVAGIIFPLITFTIIWKVSADVSLSDYFKGLQQISRLSSLVSLSAIPNLLLFFLFIWTNSYRAARGVIFATFLLAFLMLILKFV